MQIPGGLRGTVFFAEKQVRIAEDIKIVAGSLATGKCSRSPTDRCLYYQFVVVGVGQEEVARGRSRARGGSREADMFVHMFDASFVTRFSENVCSRLSIHPRVLPRLSMQVQLIFD